jgi:hypothetical protein
VPGCEVEFFYERGRLYIEKIEAFGRGARLVDRMRGRGRGSVRVELTWTTYCRGGL